MLKPLDVAIRDNDTIRAVVRSTAIAQDGKTPGITLPSREAQGSLIRSTYAKAGLELSQTGFFEAHGTGTVAGDAAELGAIGDAFANAKSSDNKLLVGSVKTNVGHLEGTAGLAGIIKAILSVEKGQVPQNLYYEKPHPDNDLEKYQIRVPTDLMQWPLPGVRRASINCFGFGGTIAHVILDDAPSFASRNHLTLHHNATYTMTASSDTDSGVDVDPDTCASSESDNMFGSGQEELSDSKPTVEEAASISRHCSHLVVWSAPEQDAVSRNMTSVLEYLRGKEGSRERKHKDILSDLAYTLCTRRSPFPWRAFSVADTERNLLKTLEQSQPRATKTTDDGNLVLAFTGQGAQWPRMGQELFTRRPFRQSLNAADDYLKSIGAEWSVLEELQKPAESTRINEPAISQTLCTVIQTALVDLLNDWAVRPSVVVGHSSGEIAATYCAGAITVEDAWKLAYYRGAVAQQASQGSMMAIGLSADDLEEHLSKVAGRGVISIACFNSPKNITVSGDESGIDELQVVLTDAGVFNRKLKVSRPYHSNRMQTVAPQYFDSIQDIRPRGDESMRCRMFSSVTGNEIEAKTLSASYFVKNLTSPVRFQEALAAASIACKMNCVLEVGPHSALQSAIRQTLESKAASVTKYSSMLFREKDAVVTALHAAGTLWANGCQIDLEKVNAAPTLDRPKCLVNLPPYAWNHMRSYWWESSQSRAQRFRKYPRLDLLGAPDPTSTNLQMKWRNFIRPKEVPWILDHQVQDSVLYPGAGMLIMVLEAAQQFVRNLEDVQGFEFYGVRINKAMVVPKNHHLETSLSIIACPTIDDRYNFAISSKLSEDKWQENCTGAFSIRRHDPIKDINVSPTSAADAMAFESADLKCTKTLSPRNLYEKFENMGMNWGPTFQCVTQLRASAGGNSVAVVRIPDTQSVMPTHYEQPHLLHPTTFDAMFQSMVLACPTGMGPKVPTSIEYVYVAKDLPKGPGKEFVGHSAMQESGLRFISGDIHMHVDRNVDPAIVIKGLVCSDFGGSADHVDNDFRDLLCCDNVWKEDLDLLSEKQLAEIAQIEKVVDLATHKNPNLAILEVNTGTGNLTRRILKKLSEDETSNPRVEKYTSTDPSTDFVNRAEDHVGFVEYRKLDLETNALEQGFAAASFDIVVASSIFRSTQSADGALRHLSMLLKPRGKLLLEQQRPMDEEGLIKVLKHNGFSAPNLIQDSQQAVQQVVSGTISTTLEPSDNNRKTKVNILRLEHDKQLNELALLLQDKSSEHFEVEIFTLEEAKASDQDGKVVVSLLDLRGDGVAAWSDTEFESIKEALLRNKKTLWITRGAMIEPTNPGAASMLGLLRSLRYEDASLKPYMLDLDPSRHLHEPQTLDVIYRVLNAVAHLDANSLEYEFAERNGRVLIPRAMPHTSMNRALTASPGSVTVDEPFMEHERSLALEIGTPGQLETLRFIQVNDDRGDLGSGEVQLRVLANAVHDVDAMTMHGQTRATTFGSGVAGEVIEVGSQVDDIHIGDRVATFQPDSVRNTIRSAASTLTKLPASLSFESAAAMAKDYTAAYHALVNVARLEPGERCLIVNAVSIFGRGALQIALYLGVEVYAVASSAAERDILTSLCDLSPDRVLGKMSVTSRSHGKDRYWDVILCEEQTSDVEGYWRRMADFGRLVQVVSGVLRQENTRSSCLDTKDNATFSTLNIEVLRQRQPQKCAEAMKAVFALFGNGAIHSPASIIGLPYSKTTEAYTKVLQLDNLDSIVLYAEEGDLVPVVATDAHPLSSHLRADATYVIVGGLGGLGRSIASYLVQNGARHLVFLSRSGGKSGEVQEFLHTLRQDGAITALAPACDVVDKSQLQHTIDAITTNDELPPIRGVIQAAMVLRDQLCENMSYADFVAAVRPKIHGSWNLHELLPRDLDFFIMLSSIAGVGGMRGQTNYAAGNSYQDALALYRRGLGLPAVTIDLTVVLGVGYVSENTELIDGLKQAGVLTITEEELHKLLKAAITGYTVGEERTPAQIITGVASGGYLARMDIQDSMWFNDNRFAHMCKLGLPTAGSGPTDESNSTVHLPSTLPSVKSLPEATALVTSALVSKLAKALGMPAEDIETSRCVSDYGVDSLVAVELRNWIQRQARATVSIFDLMSPMALKELAGKIAEGSLLVKNEMKGKGAGCEVEGEML